MNNLERDKILKKRELAAAGIISGLLLVYLLLRAVLVPVTHDEAATFFHYVRPERFFPPVTREEANNHYLNTLLTYVSYKAFGSDAWALRLPNVLFSLLFFYYWFGIVRFLSNRLLRRGLFITVVFSLYFLDFFALSRGYGMSVAFFSGALFHTVKLLKERGKRDMLYAGMYMVLALAANLSMVLPVLAVLLILYGVFFSEKWHKSPKRYFFLIPQTVAAGTAVFMLLKLKQAGALYLGTPNGGIINAVRSWLFLFTGGSSPAGLSVVILLTVLAFGAALYGFLTDRRKYFRSAGFVFDFLLFGTLAGAFLSHLLFGVYYPEGRTGLYFLPLFAGTLFFSAERLPGRWVFLLPLPLLYLPVHFFTHINTRYANDYKNEVIPLRFFNKVAADTVSGLPAIGGYHMETTTWAYINYKHGGRCNLIDWTNFPEELQDYQLFDVDLFPGIAKRYDTVDFEPLSNLALLKRRLPVKKVLLKKIDIKRTESFTTKTFFNLFEMKKGISGRNFLLDINLNLSSKQRVLRMWIVVQGVDKNGKSLIYKYIPIDWLKDFNGNSPEKIRQTINSGIIPQGVKALKIYLWNLEGQPYKTEGGSLTVYQTEKD